MGCNQSSQPDSGLDATVGKELNQAKTQQQSVKKLLLLGAGGSGKSTFFKQLQIIHGNGFTDAERKNFRTKIREQIFGNIRLLVLKSQDLVADDPTNYSQLKIDPSVVDLANDIARMPVTTELTPEMAEKIKTVWNDPGIQAAWKIRAQLCVVDSTEYFMKEIDTVASPSYLPTDQDLVLNRYMTTGMTEKQFNIKGSTMTIVDVGGQRSERRKWIHFFDGCTAVLFVTSLSAFDELLFEDTSKNVMVESLEVFDGVWTSHWFDNTPVILFLNKADLLEEKLANGGSIKQAFPDYPGADDDMDASIAYIKQLYESRATGDAPGGLSTRTTSVGERNIYAHVTTATDSQNVERVFNDVQHIIINSSLTKNFLT